MKNKSLFLTENEKKRILEMHYNAAGKKILTEQGDTEPITVNIGEFKIVGETTSALTQCAEVYIEGSFPALNTKDNEKIANAFQEKILSVINSNEMLSKSRSSGSLSITEVKIVGGASNTMYSKSTPYDMNNNREMTTPIEGEKFDVDNKSKTYIDNKQLAINRASNFSNALETTILPNLKIGYAVETPTIEGYVINTGGVVDSKKTEQFPKPGQVVMVYMKLCGIEINKQDVVDCFTGLKVEVSYDRTRNDLNKDPITKKGVDHICNNATYEIYGNGILLKNVNGTNYADLNNGKGSSDFNQYSKEDPSIGNVKRGGSRRSEFIIDQLTAKDFVNFDNYSKYNGDLSIVVKCVNPKNVKSENWGYGCHSSASLIKILKPDGTPVDKSEYIGTPPGKKNDKKELVRVAACKTNELSKNE